VECDVRDIFDVVNFSPGIRDCMGMTNDEVYKLGVSLSELKQPGSSHDVSDMTVFCQLRRCDDRFMGHAVLPMAALQGQLGGSSLQK
jgi:hypothetical protein